MKIVHHLSEPILMAYAAGTLPEGFSLLVATHISLCDECRASLAALDALGGAVLERADPVDLAQDSLTAMMARLDRPLPPQPRQQARQGGLPGPLVDYIGGGLEKVRWRPVGLGVRQALLPVQDRGATVRLLYIPAGQAVPDHGHRGLEMTLVLQGAFRDEVSRFGPGDVEIADEALEHTPVAEPQSPCICLAATSAPLRFRGLLPRLAQPFFRI